MNLLEGLNEEAPSESIPWKKDALNLLACKMWEVKTQPETILFFKCCQQLTVRVETQIAVMAGWHVSDQPGCVTLNIES